MIQAIFIYSDEVSDPKVAEILHALRAIDGLQDCQILGFGPYESVSQPCDNYGRTQKELAELANIPEIHPLEPPISKTELCQGRTDKQRKEQDKWRRRFYHK